MGEEGGARWRRRRWVLLACGFARAWWREFGCEFGGEGGQCEDSRGRKRTGGGGGGGQ